MRCIQSRGRNVIEKRRYDIVGIISISTTNTLIGYTTTHISNLQISAADSSTKGSPDHSTAFGGMAFCQKAAKREAECHNYVQLDAKACYKASRRKKKGLTQSRLQKPTFGALFMYEGRLNISIDSATASSSVEPSLHRSATRRSNSPWRATFYASPSKADMVQGSICPQRMWSKNDKHEK